LITGTGFLPDCSVTVRIAYRGEDIVDYLTYTSDADGYLNAALPETAIGESLLTGLRNDTPRRRYSLSHLSGMCHVMQQDSDRTLDGIVLPRWGRVEPSDGPIPWTVVTGEGTELVVVHQYLREVVARGGSPLSTRSYAYDLLRWWRWLIAVGVQWDRATSTDVKDYVLWMRSATKPRRYKRTLSAATAGTINPLTHKRYLDDHYRARTIRHSNAVLRDFYAYWISAGEGPLLNPVRIDHRSSGRPHAGHNPLQPFRAEGRLAYNPKLPKQQPRALADERWLEVFSALRSNRDRALLSLTVSSAARSAEIVGLHLSDVDWGEQLIRVHRKGSRAPQWLPAGRDSFVWLRLYLAMRESQTLPGTQ
jgi:integrase/recombinase XerD